MQESGENTLPKLIHPGHRLILASIMMEIMCQLVYEAFWSWSSCDKSWTPGPRVSAHGIGFQSPAPLPTGLYEYPLLHCRRSGARGEGAVFMTWRTIYHPLAHFAARVLMSEPFFGMGGIRETRFRLFFVCCVLYANFWHIPQIFWCCKYNGIPWILWCVCLLLLYIVTLKISLVCFSLYLLIISSFFGHTNQS